MRTEALRPAMPALEVLNVHSSRPILVAVDASASTAILCPAAVSLARSTGSSLLLAHVLPASTIAAQLHHARERLERIARFARLQGVVASTVLLAGDPVEQIVSYTAGNSVGTVALGSYGDWENCGLRGSVADAIVRQSPVPVLVWRIPLGETHAASSTLRHLLVPLDGSRPAERVVPEALTLARATGARVLLVQAVRPFPPLVGGTAGELERRELQVAGEYLASVREQFSHLGVPIDVTVRLGRPSDVIHWVVRETAADLVLMATHGRSGLRRERLGSVALDLLRRDVPMLLHGPGVAASWEARPPVMLDLSPRHALAS